MIKTIFLGAALSALGSMSFADISTQDVIDSFQSEGFSRVEVKTGPTQTKVEAIRGQQKVEVVYDRATGNVLKSETERLSPRDQTENIAGLEVSNGSSDFIDVSQLGDDDSMHNQSQNSHESEDEDDDDRNHSGSSVSDDDDHGSADSEDGSDDDHDSDSDNDHDSDSDSDSDSDHDSDGDD